MPPHQFCPRHHRSKTDQALHAFDAQNCFHRSAPMATEAEAAALKSKQFEEDPAAAKVHRIRIVRELN